MRTLLLCAIRRRGQEMLRRLGACTSYPVRVPDRSVSSGFASLFSLASIGELFQRFAADIHPCLFGTDIIP